MNKDFAKYLKKELHLRCISMNSSCDYTQATMNDNDNPPYEKVLISCK